MITIETFSLGPIATNAYLLTAADQQEALLIDAPPTSASLVQKLLLERGVKLIGLLLTHGHWDHIADAKILQDSAVPVYSHREDQIFLEMPEVMGPFVPSAYPIFPVRETHFLEDNQVINLLGASILVRHVPGHSPGSIAFYIPSLQALFAGDAIFQNSIGRTDLPHTSGKALKEAIQQKIYTLPDETVIYPGHGPTTTVGHEKQHNPFVRLNS